MHVDDQRTYTFRFWPPSTKPALHFHLDLNHTNSTPHVKIFTDHVDDRCHSGVHTNLQCHSTWKCCSIVVEHFGGTCLMPCVSFGVHESSLHRRQIHSNFAFMWSKINCSFSAYCRHVMYFCRHDVYEKDVRFEPTGSLVTRKLRFGIASHYQMRASTRLRKFNQSWGDPPFCIIVHTISKKREQTLSPVPP